MAGERGKYYFTVGMLIPPSVTVVLSGSGAEQPKRPPSRAVDVACRYSLPCGQFTVGLYH